MAFTYGFYNSLNSDRVYNAEQVSSIFDGIIKDGVYQGIGDKLFTIPGTGLTVQVKTGRAWFDHTWSYNDSPMILPIATPDVTLDRWDAVVLEVNRDDSVRANTIKVITGTPGSNPAKPSLTNTTNVKQYPLAYVYVDHQASSIAANKIEITVGTSACPFVTGIIQATNIDTLFQQWDYEFNTWFDNLVDQMSDNVATNLQNQINVLRSDTDNLKDQSFNQAYDLYTLWLKAYYQNGTSWSPDVLGAKSLLFDGFTNNSYSNNNNVNAQVSNGRNTDGRFILPSVSDISAGIPTSNKDNPSSALRDAFIDIRQYGCTITSGWANILYNDDSYYSWYGSLSYSSSVIKTVTITPGSPISFTKIGFHTYGGDEAGVRLRSVQVSYDGSNFTTVADYSSTNSGFGKAISPYRDGHDGLYYIDCAVNNARAVKFQFTGESGTSGSSTHTEVRIYRVSFLYTAASLPLTRLVSKTYSLPETYKKVRVFVSMSTNSNITVSGSFQSDRSSSVNGTLISNRSDPMFEGYTEYEYEIEANSANSYFTLFVAKSEGIDTSVSIKRYGVYFVE